MAAHTYHAGDHVGGIPVTPLITLTGGTRLDLLGPLEGPVYELRVRLQFLTEHFAHKDGYRGMGHEMLHLMLADCRNLAAEACDAHEKAWLMTGGDTE